MIYEVYILLFAGAFWVITKLIAMVVIRFYRKSKAIFDARINELGFIVSREAEYRGLALYVDETNRKWVVRTNVKDENPSSYAYEDLVAFELIEKGASVSHVVIAVILIAIALLIGINSDVLSIPAVIVGILFIVRWDVIGVLGLNHLTCATLNIVIRTKDIEYPQVDVRFITTTIRRGSRRCKTAHETAREFMTVLTCIQDCTVVSESDENTMHNELCVDK